MLVKTLKSDIRNNKYIKIILLKKYIYDNLVYTIMFF